MEGYCHIVAESLFALCVKIKEKVLFNIEPKLHVKQYYPIGQKLVENAKIENLECDILTDFQTLCLWKCLILQNCHS